MYSQYLKLAEELVREGGEVALTNFHRHKFAAEWKSDHSLVTSTDTQIEFSWREKIKATFPNHHICGEEYGGKSDTSQPTWILDPLDGTTNFSLNIPLFCSMAALQIEDRIVCAAVSAPVQHLIFCAQLGEGATINQEPFPQLSTETSLDNVTLLIDSGKAKQARERSHKFLSLYGNQFRSFRKFGCMLAPLLFAAESRLDLEVIFDADLYDIAGLSLIFKEAGYTLLGHNGQAWYKDASTDFIVTTPQLVPSISNFVKTAETQIKENSDL